MSDEPSQAASDAGGDAHAAGVVPTEPKRREHYNTQLLVANFEKEERRTRLILIGVAVALGAGIAAALFLGGGGEKKEGQPVAEGAADEPVKAVPAAGAPATQPPAGTPAPAAAPAKK